MRHGSCCVIACGVVVWLALSATAETRIEGDKDGNEYGLKRFHIQGRQVTGNGSKPQYVITRRKRSTRSSPSPGTVVLPSVSVSSQKLNLVQPAEHREGLLHLPLENDQSHNSQRYVELTALPGVQYEGEPLDENEDDDDDYDDEDDDDDNDEDDDLEDDLLNGQQLDDMLEQRKKPNKKKDTYVPAALALPLADGTATHLPQGISVLAGAASHANVGDSAGIVVVQSNKPPKVNPETHAVFELKPVTPQANSGYPHTYTDDKFDYDEDEDEDDDYYYYGDEQVLNANGQPALTGDDFDEHYVSVREDSPVSTTAIWSTGDDGDIYPLVQPVNERPNKNKNNKNKNKNKNKKKNKHKKGNKKPSTQPMRPIRKRRPGSELDEKEEQLLSKPSQSLYTKKKQQQQKPDQRKKKKKKKKKKKNKKKPQTGVSNNAGNTSSSSGNQGSVGVFSSSTVRPTNRPRPSQTPPDNAASSSSSSSSSSATSMTTRKKKKRRRPSSSSSSSSASKKKKKSNKRRQRVKKRRRRPSSNAKPIGGYRRRHGNYQIQQRRRLRRIRQQQQQQQQQQRQRMKNRQNQSKVEPGECGGMTCIIVNMQTSTTQRPPFINIFGRNNDNVSGNVKEPTEAPKGAVFYLK